MNNYWQTEEPIEATSAGNMPRWFREAERFQVSLPDWTDGDGETPPGKRGNTRRVKILVANDSRRQEAYGSV